MIEKMKKIDLYSISLLLFLMAILAMQIPKKNFGALILMGSLMISIVATKCKEISKSSVVINTLITIGIFICIVFNDIEFHSYYKRSQIYAVLILLVISIFFNVKKIISLFWSYKEKKTFILVCFVAAFFSVVLNLDVVNAWLRWDSHIYYCAIQNMTIHNLLTDNGLQICGHVCTGYALWVFMLKSIPYLNQVEIQHIGNVIQLFCDTILLFYIAKKITKKSNVICLIIAICGILSPYMMGLVYVTYPERIVVSGVLLYIFGLYSKNSYSKLLGIFLMLSKETVIPAAAVMVFLELIMEIKTNRSKISDYSIIYFSTALFIGLMWLFQFTNSGWGSTAKTMVTDIISGSREANYIDQESIDISQEVAKVGHEAAIVYPLKDGAAFNKFGISKVHMGDTFKGVFLTNFMWLPAGIIIFAILWIMIKRIRVENAFNYFILFVGLVFHYLFTSLYVTYHFNRYYTVLYVFIFVIFVISVNFLIKNRVFYFGIYILFGLLFFIQCYKTIDPFMLKVFPTYSTGRGTIMMLTQGMQNFHDPFFNDGALYNKEVCYFDDAINKALSQCDIDNNTLIVFSDEYQGKIGVGALFSLWGFLYEDYKPVYYASWNEDKQCRELALTDEKQINYQFVMKSDDIEFEDYDRVYYLEMPWEDTVIMQMDDICIQEMTGKNYDWIIKVHQLK